MITLFLMKAQSIGERLSQVMEEKKLNPSRLELISGIPASTVREMVKDERSFQLGTIVAVGSAINTVPISYWDLESQRWETAGIDDYFKNPPNEWVFKKILSDKMYELDMSAPKLAKESKVGVTLIYHMFRGKGLPRSNNFESILETIGVVPFYFADKGYAPLIPKQNDADKLVLV